MCRRAHKRCATDEEQLARYMRRWQHISACHFNARSRRDLYPATSASSLENVGGSRHQR